MKTLSGIILLVLISNTSFSQIDKELFIDLSVKIINQKKIRENLKNNTYYEHLRKSGSELVAYVFVAETCGTRYYSLYEDIKIESAKILFSNIENLFMFGAYSYWFCPLSININDTNLIYNFRTCSNGQVIKKYIEGFATFENQEGKWELKKLKVTKSKVKCVR